MKTPVNAEFLKEYVSILSKQYYELREQQGCYDRDFCNGAIKALSDIEAYLDVKIKEKG